MKISDLNTLQFFSDSLLHIGQMHVFQLLVPICLLASVPWIKILGVPLLCSSHYLPLIISSGKVVAFVQMWTAAFLELGYYHITI